tara:strand:+ start:487 stop:1287 length:801 start_codon:yes stop_codon:yes gene_type:complete
MNNQNMNMQETITTLDNRIWDKEELLERMTDDDFYYRYLGVNALSSSAIKKLLSSPREYEDSLMAGSKTNPAFEFGWLFHTAILEPHVYEKQVFVDVRDRRSKGFKEALSMHQRPFTTRERDEVERLADSFYSNSRAVDMMQHTRKEVPAIGNLFGLPFRAKADVLGDGYILDLKTTKNINKFEYSAREYLYRCQAYIYCKLFDIDYRDFTFIAVDKETATIGFYGVSEKSFIAGGYDVEQAVDVYKEYFVDRNKEVYDYQLEGDI